MKNKDVKICLMVNGAKIPSCEQGMSHQFEETEGTEGHASGWHVQVCRACGLEISFDTSD